MKKIGLFINPIAGMGGRIGLKGTDGADIVKLTRERGAVPESSTKAMRALKKLLPLKNDCVYYVAQGAMGEIVAQDVGLTAEVVLKVDGETNATDSQKLLKRFRAMGVDLILFDES